MKSNRSQRPSFQPITSQLSPPLTRLALKRKRERGEDVQLLAGLEVIPRVCITRCPQVDLGALMERYRADNIDELVKGGVDSGVARQSLETELTNGEACFQTIEASRPFIPFDEPPERVTPLSEKQVQKKRKLNNGVYLIHGVLQEPSASQAWEQKPTLTASSAKTSHRPPPKPRDASTKANRSARHGKKKKRGGWRVDPSISQKEKSERRRQLRTVVYQNRLFSLDEDTLSTTPGWNGKNPSKDSVAEINRQWDDGTIGLALQRFHRVPVHDVRSPVILTDSKDRVFLYRTDQRPWLKEFTGPEFVKLCGLLTEGTNYQGIKLPATRGPHFPIIIGYQRQYTETPELTLFHTTNYDAVEKFINSKLTKSVSRHVTNCLTSAFDGVAARYARCAAWHLKKHNIKPQFGLFWNFCLNVPHPDDGRVHCRPHTDHKNIVGVCAVLVYEMPGANFNHKRRSWLVIWDAGVMLEAAPWMITFYPSALFYHFNIDPCDFEVVSAPERETPTRLNSTTLHDGYGRGSMVFFNQASLFQSSETGYNTLEQAEAKGVSRIRDFGSDINSCFQQHGKTVPFSEASS